MRLVASLQRAALLLRLSRGRSVRLGGGSYRVRGVVADTGVALRDDPVNGILSSVYRAILECKEGTFVDVGANTGQTLLTILAIDKSRPYVGFEPQASCCFLLQTFIEDNNLGSHAIVPVALSDKNQLLKLRSQGDRYDQTASIVEGFRPESFYRSQRWVSARKGDEAMAELQIPSLSVIKIDVEGAELEVITGLLATIREERPFLVFEVLNDFLVATGQKLNDETRSFRAYRLQRLEGILRDEDYEIYNVTPKGPVTVKEIKPAVSADLSATNYVAVPRQKVGDFMKACGSGAL
jgi:FkbM family methyltransferase